MVLILSIIDNPIGSFCPFYLNKEYVLIAIELFQRVEFVVLEVSIYDTYYTGRLYKDMRQEPIGQCCESSMERNYLPIIKFADFFHGIVCEHGVNNVSLPGHSNLQSANNKK